MVPPLITLEEHYLSTNIRAHLQSTGKPDPYTSFPEPLMQKLTSLSTSRITDLDAGRISLQVLSHSPLNASPSECRITNDTLASTCASNPRYAGFAMLPMSDPTAAAEELTHCVKDLGFVGTLINNHFEGEFYDAEKYWPVFARAEELDVPVYIHPTFAADEWLPHYSGNFSQKAAFSMSIAGWGWHSETALHVLRLWASGLFDKYPKLKIVIGHMGEMLPFQLDRIFPISETWASHRRSLREVWRENFWVTTSGMFSLAPMGCLLKMCGKDRVLYSVDYPFSGNEKGLKFLKELEGSGLVTQEEFEGICYKNAERLLGVKVPR